MKLLFLLNLFLFSSACSTKKDFDSVPVARVNDKFLTLSDIEKELNVGIASNDDVAKFAHGWVEEQLLYQAALNEKLNLDKSLIKKRDIYYRKLLANTFLSSAVTLDVSIDNDDIKKYYSKNRSSFVRKYDEAVVYHFSVEDKTDADKIRKALLSGSSGKRRKDLFLKHKTEPVTVKKGFLIKDLDKRIFSKNKKSVIGPVFSKSNYHVIQIIKKHKRGSVVSLDRAYDEIYNRLLQNEKKIALSSVMDSLRNSSTIYINKEMVLK
tara:strand:- start:871 stop:1668 length:798 start_codon:yes stop_codon:yes gene_type:complete